MKRALIPDRQLKISEPESKPVKYFKEDSNLINDLEGKRASRNMGTYPDGHIVVPFSILWKLILREDKKMYWANRHYKVQS